MASLINFHGCSEAIVHGTRPSRRRTANEGRLGVAIVSEVMKACRSSGDGEQEECD